MWGMGEVQCCSLAEGEVDPGIGDVRTGLGRHRGGNDMGSFEKGAAEVAMLGVGEVWCGSAEGEEGSPIFPFLDLQRWRMTEEKGRSTATSNGQ